MSSKKETGNTESVDFEKTLAELESLVERLESGELSLEESLRQFERGVTLTRACQQALQAAEQKVRRLSEEGGAATLEPFEGEDGS
ncbi:MAG TPA: exodeoxyribonuclease VII small subunit [Gammaproteobacteria bacterium]|nr:exodeoxyribonuclease VII small subunit [Gammaproteobacteria bacterium]